MGVSIYRSSKGYLPWIRYVAHQKNSSTPYDVIVGSGQGTTKCTPTRKSVPLLEEVYPYEENFHSLLEEYSFYEYLPCHTE